MIAAESARVFIPHRSAPWSNFAKVSDEIERCCLQFASFLPRGSERAFQLSCTEPIKG